MAKTGGDALTHALKKLRARRESLGLSQAEVAELVGVNPSFIGLLERGDRVPSIDVLLKFAVAVQLPAAQLFVFGKASSPSDHPELIQLRAAMKGWAPAKRRALVDIAKAIGKLDS